MKVKIYWKIKAEGISPVILPKKEALGFLKDIPDEDFLSAYTIEMTEKEYKKLPEFEG